MAIITTGLNIDTAIAVNSGNPIGEMSTNVKILNLTDISYSLPDENNTRSFTAKAQYYLNGEACRVWIPISVKGSYTGDITVDRTWEAVKEWMQDEYGLTMSSRTKELV